MAVDPNNRMNIILDRKLKETLRENLPEFQRGDNPLVSYTNTTGEVLDEMRTTIHALSGYLNWNDAPLDRINQLAASFGFNFPRNLGEETRRTIVRDIFNIYKRNGTPDMFRWVFKIIGWEVTLQYAWALNPVDLMRGKRDIIYNGEFTYNGDIQYDQQINVDLERFNYQNFVYGESRVTQDGVFFYGKDYFDNANAPGYTERYQKIPIQGERYPNLRFDENDNYVAATPYLIVRITSQDYRLFTEPYTDPDTGITYEYTDSERFAIAEELINFLLYERGRPLHVRVIVIVTDDIFEENISRVTDDLTQDFMGWTDNFTDFLSRVQAPEQSHADIGSVLIGYNHVIGGWTNPVSEVSSLEGLTIGTGTQVLQEIPSNTTEIIPLPLHKYFVNGQLETPVFMMRYGAQVSFTVPAGGYTFSVYGIEVVDKTRSKTNPVLIGTYTSGNTANFTVTDYHGMYVTTNAELGSGYPDIPPDTNGSITFPALTT